MNSLRSFDGTRIAWFGEEGRGAGPAVLLSHGSSFNSGIWRPVRRLLAPVAGRMVSFDHRSHGLSQGGSTPASWWDCARDLEGVAVAAGGDMVGIGHSMGGAALLLASASRCGLFSGLVLIEPIVAPPPFRRDLEHPIIEMAGRRRAAFDSRESARESLRRAFPDWDPEALEGYFESALTSAEEEWRLACSPTQEVDIYRAGFSAGVLDHLSRVDIPVRILVGGAEDTYPTAWAEEFAQRCRSATVEVVEGADHFLPMTRPDAVVEAYARLAASLMPRKRRRRPALHP